MFVVHLSGRGVHLRREWFDTSHPALAGFTRDWPTARGRNRGLVRPLMIGERQELALPGLRPLHAILEQASPGEVRVRAPVPVVELFVEGARVFDTLPLPLGAELRFEGYSLRLRAPCRWPQRRWSGWESSGRSTTTPGASSQTSWKSPARPRSRSGCGSSEA